MKNFPKPTRVRTVGSAQGGNANWERPKDESGFQPQPLPDGIVEAIVDHIRDEKKSS